MTRRRAQRKRSDTGGDAVALGVVVASRRRGSVVRGGKARLYVMAESASGCAQCASRSQCQWVAERSVDSRLGYD